MNTRAKNRLPESRNDPLRIAVIGLGVAGGVLASGLTRREDVEVIAVEKVGPDDHAHAGNGLNVGPNAMRALAAVLPGMADDLHGASLPWTRWDAKLSDGTPLYHIPLEEVADSAGIRIRWSELYRAVRKPIREQARFHATMEHLRVDPARPHPVSFTLVDNANGTRERVENIDLLIALDSRYSAVREQLCGLPETRFLGVANFRTLLEDDGKSGIDDLAQWYTGPNRLLAFRLSDGLIYLSGNFPTDANGEVPDAWRTRDWIRKAYTPRNGLIDPPCAWLIDAMENQGTELHWSRAQEIDMRFHDDTGHVLFLGDSAHAMAPTLGQGATTAIEDACAFLVALDKARAANPVAIDIPEFTAALAQARAERIAFVRQFSWDASDTLLRGADPLANQAKNGAAYRNHLQRLYMDTPAP